MEKKKYEQGLHLIRTGNNGKSAVLLFNPTAYDIRSKKQIEAYRRKREAIENRVRDPRGDFVISKNDSMEKLKRKLTIADRRYLMQLLLYAQFNNQPLSKDGEPITLTKLSEEWNLHRTIVSKKMKKFIELGIVRQETNPANKRQKIYFLENEFFTMGRIRTQNGKTKNFVKIFKKKLNEILENLKQIQEKEAAKQKSNTKNQPVEIIDVIGLLNAVMPFFHYQTYYLVKDPNKNILEGGYKTVNEALMHETLDHIEDEEIWKIFNHKKKRKDTIENYMELLQKAGAVIVTKSMDVNRYLIHPDLLFRLDGFGGDDYTNSVRALFAQHKKNIKPLN